MIKLTRNQELYFINKGIVDMIREVMNPVNSPKVEKKNPDITPKRRKLSAKARKAISVAQKKRWRKHFANKKTAQ